MEFERGDCEAGLPCETLLARSNELVEVIKQWMASPGRMVELSTGYDDFDVHNLIAIEFKSPGMQLGCYYVPRTIGERNWPGILALDSFVYEDKWKFGSPTLAIRKNLLTQHLGFDLDAVFHGGLQSRLLSFEQAIRYATMYAMSDIGNATVSRSFDDIGFEDLELEDELSEERLLTVDLGFRSPKIIGGMMPGFGESLHCLLPV